LHEKSSIASESEISPVIRSLDINEPRPMFLPALSYRHYRLLWFSGLSTWSGRWIEAVVGAWLILELTNSPFLVGLLGTCRFASTVFGPLCGTVCDRINQRSILLTVQVVYGIASLTLLALFASAQIEVWHLFAFTLLGGLCYTFDFSARYSIAAGIVKNNHIISSISLMQVASGATSVVGPLIGGSLLEIIGVTDCFSIIAVTFLLSFLALIPLKIAPESGMGNRSSIWKELVSGLDYIKKDRVLFSLLLIAALANLFLYPHTYTLMPIFARDVLGTGASGFGLLMAGAGFGTILGSLAIGSLSPVANRGKVLVGAVIAWPALLFAFAFSKSFTLSIALLVLAGIAQGISMALVQALLLMGSTEEMRGRVSGARAFAISTLSLGTFLAGYEAALWGAPAALIINTSFFIALTTLVFVWTPGLTRHK
jgi:MFS family permease